MEIMKVVEDFKESVGDKTFYILGAGVVLFALYNLSRGSGADNSANLVPVTNVASYPDAVTNADVIISTLQDSIEYSEGVITEKIEGLEQLEKDNNKVVIEKIETSAGAINDKLDSNKKLFETSFENIQGSLNDLDKNVTAINGTVTNIAKDTSSIKNSVNTINKALKKGATSIGTKNTSAKNTSAKTSGYYVYKTKSGLNTSTSIVDALKAIGVDSSMANRSKIAAANGISNYTGSYSQNVTLLSKLKSGKLKKV